MQFSFWPNPNQSISDLFKLVDHVEASGWSGVWYADHFMPNQQDSSGPTHEAFTVLAALAVRTTRLRIGSLVAGNTYRHPAVLAKMAATIDHLSNGRMVLGLGSAWQENEHMQYGIPFHDIPGRLARLNEACAVITSLFSQEKSDFEGEYYQLKQACLAPKPIQKPLPLLIGGGGEKVTLKITARYANEWNVWGTPDLLRQKMQVLDAHCERIKRDPEEIRRSTQALLFMSVDENQLKKFRDLKLQLPTIIGTPDRVTEIVADYAKAGVDELIIPDFNLGGVQNAMQTMDVFMQQVIANV